MQRMPKGSVVASVSYWIFKQHYSQTFEKTKSKIVEANCKSVNLENFWKNDYIFIPFSTQSVAKPCSSSSWDETIPREFKMARVVKTNFTFGNILFHIIFKILCKRCKVCLQKCEWNLFLKVLPFIDGWSVELSFGRIQSTKHLNTIKLCLEIH